MNDMQPEQRRLPFDKTTAINQYLVIFTDADHATFGGGGPRAKEFCPTIAEATLAFFDAHLRGDAAKQASLVGDLKKLVDTRGTVENK